MAGVDAVTPPAPARRDGPWQKIFHRIILLFFLLVLAIVGNALFATWRETRFVDEQIQAALQSRLEIAHSVFESELEALRIVTEVVRDRGQIFSEYLDYDNLAPIASMLKTLGLKFGVDRLLLYGEDGQLLVCGRGVHQPWDGGGCGTGVADGRERLGVELLPAPSFGAAAGDAALAPSGDLPGLVSVVRLLHDTGSVYGTIVLVRFVHDRAELAQRMQRFAGAEVILRRIDGEVVLSTLRGGNLSLLPDATLRVGGRRFSVAAKPLLDHVGTPVAELQVALDVAPFLARRAEHLAAVTTPFLVSLVILGWLSLLVKRRVFSRVQTMARFLRRVAGDRESRSARLPVPAAREECGRLDEIDWLWDDFNHMMDRLEESYDAVARARREAEAVNAELERRVAERTSKLAHTNDQLRREMAAHQRAEEERRQLEKQLAQAQKMEAVGTLAGGVAHDLNNILTGVVTYPEYILSKLPEDSPLRTPLTTVRRSGERAAAVVQDLLTLARRGVAVNEQVDLNEVVRDYLNSPEHERLLRENSNAGVVTALESGGTLVTGSPVHLRQALMNLVVNGVEAMPSGGTLRIATAATCPLAASRLPPGSVNEDFVALQVEDEGIGIAAEDLDRIFDPFYTKKKMGRSGTGLGMAVVWGTVEDHGGFIDARSTVGEGTTFTLCLPVVDEGAQPALSEVPTEPVDVAGSGETVLVVDDAQEQREIATIMLEDLGYRAVAVADGDRAVDWVRSQRPDLVMLDMIMYPGPGGLETYRKILGVAPEQRAIVVSGYSESADVREAQRLGAGAYVRKPYTRQRLGRAVRAELDRPRGQKELPAEGQ